MSHAASDLVRRVQGSWPQWLPAALQHTGDVTSGHVLSSEVSALLEGRSASLPFFPGGPQAEVAWVTVAPEADRLVAALADLRAWILPSLGWEDPRGTVVTGAGGAIGAAILALSPAGYIRWRSRADVGAVGEIARRLARARELAGAVPLHAQAPAPALVELRQQLAVSLAAGDRPAAEDVLATLRRLGLDTAQNALLTRIRVLDHFGDARLLVEMPELDQLLRVRLPRSARVAIARAFHRLHVQPHEDVADVPAAQAAYATLVGPRIDPLIGTLHPEDGIEALRLLAYRAAAGVYADRTALSSHATDPMVAALLPPLSPPSVPPPTDEELFFAAWQTRDWAEVQRTGSALMATRPDILPVLRRSLDWLPNPALRDALAGTAIVPGPHQSPPSPPQTWAEWLSAVENAELVPLERFLESRLAAERTVPSVTESHEIAERLTDLLTGTGNRLDTGRRSILLTGLAELAGECVGAAGFPAAGGIDLYRALARCWGEWKRGSAYPPDGQVLLEMTDGVLQYAPEDQAWLGDQVARWWEARPSRSLLPFMLGAVDLFHRLVGTTPAERFWIAVGTFVRTQRVPLTAGERILWRRVGSDIGYDAATLDEYVPLPPTTAGTTIDPLAAAGLKKIAVVSTREEQADRAAEQLRERTGADVLVVPGTVSGADTDAATTADVIAFVWSATTHAVFRAFDKVDRKRIAYVRGTGAASIVLAVERWVMENSAP